MRNTLFAVVLLGMAAIPVDASAGCRRCVTRVRVVISRPVPAVIVQEVPAVVQRVVSVPATAIVTTAFRRGFFGRLRAIRTVTLQAVDAAPPSN